MTNDSRKDIMRLAVLIIAGLCPLRTVDATDNSVAEESILEVRSGLTRYDWTWVSGKYDGDRDGRVNSTEIPVSADDFARLDRTWDQELTAEDFNWSAESALSRRKETTFALFKSADVSSDGRLTAAELQSAFETLAGPKGYVNEEELETLIFLPRVMKDRAEAAGRHRHVEFLKDDSGRLPDNLPKPGDPAPDFELSSPDGNQAVRLSSFRGKSPVVLAFGCLTCGNYRTYSETLESLFRSRRDQVAFLRVYVREAHPTGQDAATPTNRKAGFLIRQPVTLTERCEVAARCAADLDIQTPMVVDGIDNRVGRAYGGWPDRLYIIDIDGNVAYQGGPGPFAFNPREMEQTLILLLLDQASGVTAGGSGSETK